MITPRRRSVAGGLAATCLLLAGCGSSGSSDNGESSKSAQQILQDAVTAFKSAHSAHLTGTPPTSSSSSSSSSESSSSSASPSLQSLDMRVKTGGDATGSFNINGATVQLIVSGGTPYLKGKDFWAQFGGAAAANLVGDRWVKIASTAPGASQISGGVKQLGDFNALGDQLAHPKGNVTKGSTTTINGQQAVEISDDESNLYVALNGPAYPLRVETKSNTSQHLDFSDYNQDFSTSPPSDAVDLSTLLGGAGSSGGSGGSSESSSSSSSSDTTTSSSSSSS